VALIGVSGYGHVYHDLLEELRRPGAIALTAATIINPKDEPAIVAGLGAHGCKIYTDYREMLDRHRGAIDLCCIPTPIPLHAPMAEAALAAGAHVLVEKPLAATLREIEAVVAAETAARRFVAVGFQDIYAAENLALKAELLAGAIGPLQRIRGRGQWPRDTAYYRRNNWAGRRQVDAASVYDSPLSNAFSHFLNLALFLAGTDAGRSAVPADVTAELYRAQPIENFDTAALRVRTSTGVEILFYVTHSCRETFEPELLVEGDAGRVLWRHSREIRLEAAAGGGRITTLPDEQTVRRAMFQRVIQKLRDPGAFVCGPAIATEHTRCCQSAQAFPVRDVPAAWIGRSPTSGGHAQVWIRGVEEVIERAWTAGRLFSEIGCPWAPPLPAAAKSR
jgi:predicted dehydrogenase